MTDILEDTLAKLYPFATSVTTGAGAYWIVTELMNNPSSDFAMGMAFVAGAIAFAGIENGER